MTGIPYVVMTVSTALAGFDPRLEQAARSLGASRGRRCGWVCCPASCRASSSGAIFAFIHSWDELVIVLFIASRAVFTLPRQIWDGINENLDPTMAAVAVLLIVFTVALLALDGALRARRQYEGRGGKHFLPKPPPLFLVSLAPAARRVPDSPKIEVGSREDTSARPAYFFSTPQKTGIVVGRSPSTFTRCAASVRNCPALI